MQRRGRQMLVRMIRAITPSVLKGSLFPCMGSTLILSLIQKKIINNFASSRCGAREEITYAWRTGKDGWKVFYFSKDESLLSTIDSDRRSEPACPLFHSHRTVGQNQVVLRHPTSLVVSERASKQMSATECAREASKAEQANERVAQYLRFMAVLNHSAFYETYKLQPPPSLSLSIPSLQKLASSSPQTPKTRIGEHPSKASPEK